jgi:hypothetical protein
LSSIVISVTVIRRHDVALPSISATVFTTPKPHGLTIVELRIVYTRYPTGSTDRYSLAAVIKWNRLTETADTKAHFPSKFGSITILVLLPPTSIPPSKLFSVFVSDVKKKLGVDQEQKSIQAATHDSIFGGARVVSLDIVRDVPLYRRRIMSAFSCAYAHSSSASSQMAMR